MRFAEAGERDRAAIEAEIEIRRRLTEAGLDVAQPIPSANGRLVETVATDVGVFHAVVFAHLEGEQRELDDLEEAGYRTWGSALGSLHAAMDSLPDRVTAARPTLIDMVLRAGEHVPRTSLNVRDEYLEILAALAALPITAKTLRLIHLDFEPDNLVWRNGKVGMLDFDGCGHGWHAADVAFALRDLFDAGASLDHPAVRTLLDGYAAHRRVDAAFHVQIPFFSRVARFLVHASIARALDLPPDPSFPDWLTGLIARLRNRMAAYETSLSG